MSSESCIHLEYNVSGNNFASAGSASEEVKSTLKKLGISSADIRRVAIAMYEGEINMVIHAGGGVATVDIYIDRVEIVLADKGKGIADVELAMTPGWSTAPEDIRVFNRKQSRRRNDGSYDDKVQLTNSTECAVIRVKYGKKF